MQFKRILLKLSGESLMGGKQYGIDETRLEEYAQQIKEVARMGVQLGIVIGGGNIFRGLSGTSKGFDRVKGSDGDAGYRDQQSGAKFCTDRIGTKKPRFYRHSYGAGG